VTSSEQRQISLEEQCFTQGIEAYRRTVVKNQQRGSESLTDYGLRFMVKAVEPVAAAVEKFVKEAKSKPGRKHLAVKYLEQFNPDVAALIACRLVIDGVSFQSTLQQVTYLIGKALETEARFTSFEGDKPGLWKGVNRNLEVHPLGYRRSVRESMLLHTARKFNVIMPTWDKQDKYHVGLKMTDIIIEATGLFQYGWKPHRGGRIRTIEATPELLDMIRRVNDRNELFAPFHKPMVCPPGPWKSMHGGGYLTDRLAAPLVKAKTRGFFVEAEVRDMPDFYTAVNTLQDTSWSVNPKVLDIVLQCWQQGIGVGDLPAGTDIPQVTRPADYHSNPLAKREWKTRNAEAFRAKLRNESNRIAIKSTIDVAQEFKDEPAIWFPVQCDFRGRVYYRPKGLNPQGNDLARGLLTFAEGKPLGNDGAWWLAVHLANTFGEDKVSMDDRVKWTQDNSTRIATTAAEPFEDRWWMEADKPWQFLAACYEWAGFLAEGPGYVSRINVTVDGSCNGIQNFALMLRDEIAGRHVNLIPQPVPSDIYRSVAEALVAALSAGLIESENDTDAKTWIDSGLINRTMCKRPVMVLPYGGTKEACRTYVKAAVEDAGNPFGSEINAKVNYLADRMWDTMQRVIVGPMKAMDWLREISRIVGREGLPANWTTPTGFPVQQLYPKTKKIRLKTRIAGERADLTIIERDFSKLDSRKMTQAIAPNFVHSLDAAALCKTVVLAKLNGINHFAAVHDSFGTHAADMQKLSAAVRMAYVDMYRADVLEQFRQEIGAVEQLKGRELPPIPDKGELDIEQVLSSEFFFA
jgi:DNA-directed RNA polymerase